MGQKQDIPEIYIVEDLGKSQTSTALINYFWLDSKIYSSENQKYAQVFYKQLKNFDSHSSIEGLKGEVESKKENQIMKVICAASLLQKDFEYLEKESKIQQLFLFCQNQERAKLLMSNFSKIKNVSYDIDDCIKMLKKHQQIVETINTILFMQEENISLVNKYRLNYHCLISMRNRANAKNIFIQLANKLMPNEKKNIEQFDKQYSLQLKDTEKHDQTLKWVFKQSFFWSLTESITKETINPKKLAYLRLPVKDIHESILDSYKKLKKKPQQLFIVLQLSEKQSQILGISQNHFLTFTTFIKGYHSEKQARNVFKKNRKAYFFKVQYSKNKRDENLDFGFASMSNIQGQNVVFNIYNFFKVEEINMKARAVTLVYGSLSELHEFNSKNKRSQLRKQEQLLLRNYDYLENMMRKVDSQASVLQMAGYYKQSLQIYDNTVQELRKSNSSQQEMDKYIMSKAEAYKLNDRYEQAEKILLQIKSSMQPIAMVRLADVYFHRKDDTKFEKILKQIEPLMEKIKELDPQQSFKASNFMAIIMMKKGEFKTALKGLKILQNQASAHYDFRSEGIPLIHDIFRNMATCQVQLKNFQQALNLLNSTKNYQIECQGNGPDVAKTQKMIESVYTYMGNKEKIQDYKISQQKILSQEMKTQEQYLNKSRAYVNINQSFVNIKL